MKVLSPINDPKDVVTREYADHYGVCSTAAGTAAKAVTIGGVTDLHEGEWILVKFANAQTSSSPTLDVNQLGAAPIKRIGTTNAVKYEWSAGELLLFVYDGANWLMINGGLASTSYYGITFLQTSATSTKTDRAMTPASLNNLVSGMIANIPVYSSSATYAIGDLVRYSYQIWECNTAISTAESWNAEHWTALDPLLDLINDKYTKPANGIPAEDLASGVIPSVPLAYDSDPAMDGTASPGDSMSWARGNHVHPSDTSKQAKITASGILKGDGNGSVSAAVAGTDYAVAPLSVSQSSPSTLTVADNTTYYLSNVSTLTVYYPASGHWECLLVITTASSGTVTITLPASSYIGTAPTFGNSETWELSIRDGVVVAGKAEAAS